MKGSRTFRKEPHGCGIRELIVPKGPAFLQGPSGQLPLLPAYPMTMGPPFGSQTSISYILVGVG